MLLKNSEFPLKVKFSDEAFQNIFVGVAGDNQSRVLEVTILDLDNNIYKEDIPSFKILAKGDLDKKVYYNVGTKKTAGVYTVEIPSQVFKQSQNVEIQFLIENEETHERIFSPMIKQRVQRGFCANFEEGTNIYLDYEEILKFEENFDDFLNLISQDKDAILLEMIKVKDENKAEILLLKGDFEQASKDVLDTVNKLKDETVEFGNNTKEEIKNTSEQFKSDLVLLKGDFEEASEQAVAAANKAKEEAIAAADTVKEEIGTASEQAIAEIKKELGVIKTETVEEMNSIKLSTIANVTEKGNQINASLTENKELILTAIAEKETSTINKITEKESGILLSLQTKIDSTTAEITELANTEIEKFKGLATEEISKAVEDLKSQIEESKSGILGEISDLVATSKEEINGLKTTSIAEIYTELEKVLASIKSKETDSLTAIDKATQEAIESIVNEAGEAVIPPQVLEDIKNKASKEELEEGLSTKAEKAHKHEISDVNTLTEKLDAFATNTSVDEKLSEIKLEDTAINVIAKDKKLSEVLVDLENTDKSLGEKQGTMQAELNGKALKVHKHSTSDVTGLDELIASIELKDTAIDVVSESKKLDIVLKELREKDTLLTSTIATTSESVRTLETKTTALDEEIDTKADKVHKHLMADITNISDLDSKFSTKGELQSLSTKVSTIENELGIYSNRIKAVSTDLDSLI